MSLSPNDPAASSSLTNLREAILRSEPNAKIVYGDGDSIVVQLSGPNSTCWADICEEESEYDESDFSSISPSSSLPLNLPNVWIIFKDAHDYESLRFGTLMENATDLKLRDFLHANRRDYPWWHAYDPANKIIIAKPERKDYCFQKIPASTDYVKRATDRIAKHVSAEIQAKYPHHFPQVVKLVKKEKKKTRNLEIVEGETFDGEEVREEKKPSPEPVSTSYPLSFSFLDTLRKLRDEHKVAWDRAEKGKADMVDAKCVQAALQALILSEVEDTKDLIHLLTNNKAEQKRLAKKRDETSKKAAIKQSELIEGLEYFSMRL